MIMNSQTNDVPMCVIYAKTRLLYHGIIEPVDILYEYRYRVFTLAIKYQYRGISHVESGLFQRRIFFDIERVVSDVVS